MKADGGVEGRCDDVDEVDEVSGKVGGLFTWHPD